MATQYTYTIQNENATVIINSTVAWPVELDDEVYYNGQIFEIVRFQIVRM